MKKYKWLIILINLVLILILFNKSIWEKEKILAAGKIVFLKLAPVDPRSLLQGDYMRLNYEIADSVRVDSISPRGYCIVKVDNKGVAHKVRFQEDILPLNTGEYAIVYTKSNWNINIGAESFFFEEGRAKNFESAKYGGIKIDNNGNGVLVGLYNEALKKLE